ncbi:phosphotransferase family protein [Streptomyces sp. NPDC053474]|uniref:phosphotransferase family protein n=1 Tax=Streptomyces sp. NPDC053474 TaxID=3365704 RepID=UPI0037CDDFB2
MEADLKATYGELGGVLRDLHSMTVPEGLHLPSYEPFDKSDVRLDKAALPDDDKTFLRKRARELQDKCAELKFETPKGPVHGDAHVQNLMTDVQGRVILIDFEVLCYDHPEWDLMVTSEQYADFVGAYGRDLSTGRATGRSAGCRSST